MAIGNVIGAAVALSPTSLSSMKVLPLLKSSIAAKPSAFRPASMMLPSAELAHDEPPTPVAYTQGQADAAGKVPVTLIAAGVGALAVGAFVLVQLRKKR